jgi:hypothetical protein
MMEKNFYHNDFEDLIKEKADQYKMYPSDKVWKNINRSLKSRKKWYWTGFVILLSGVSYLSITELMKPPPARSSLKIQAHSESGKMVTAEQLIPFSSPLSNNISAKPDLDDTVLSAITVEDSGTITASFDIPLQLADAGSSVKQTARGSLLIEGLEPLAKNEVYNIELSLPSGKKFLTPGEENTVPAQGRKLIYPAGQDNQVNWLQDQAKTKPPAGSLKRISWQLAFSPTVNYRKLTGGNNAKISSLSRNIPLALQIEGDVNSLVNHRPALGFELGTHGFLSLTERINLKGGIQFNYSKYDITAYRTASELATISLNPSAGRNLNSLTSYTDIRNFGGAAVDDLKNQYFQFSLPVGLEFKVFGNDRLQFDIAGTVQPTYLMNRNSYLITTDYKNYTRAPSLVRRWNMNAGAEAYLSYSHNGVKWQVGPQFRYQLLSTYSKEYPIKEYLMEYGIKVGITKTIR